VLGTAASFSVFQQSVVPMAVQGDTVLWVDSQPAAAGRYRIVSSSGAAPATLAITADDVAAIAASASTLAWSDMTGVLTAPR
jgi:hypothetical protein